MLEIEQYAGAQLPMDYEITHLLDDVIMVEFADVIEGGLDMVRHGVIIPHQVADQKAWRIGKIKLCGPTVKQVKKNDYIIFAGDRGIPAIKKDGKMVVFLNESRIFGICKPSKK